MSANPQDAQSSLGDEIPGPKRSFATINIGIRKLGELVSTSDVATDSPAEQAGCILAKSIIGMVLALVFGGLAFAVGIPAWVYLSVAICGPYLPDLIDRLVGPSRESDPQPNRHTRLNELPAGRAGIGWTTEGTSRAEQASADQADARAPESQRHKHTLRLRLRQLFANMSTDSPDGSRTDHTMIVIKIMTAAMITAVPVAVLGKMGGAAAFTCVAAAAVFTASLLRSVREVRVARTQQRPMRK